MTPKQYAVTFARFWWLILLLTAIGYGFGASQNGDRATEYTSTSRVSVLPTKVRAQAMNDRYLVSVRAAQAVTVAKSRMPLYVTMLEDPELLARVKEEFGTELTPGDMSDHATASVIPDSTSLLISYTDPVPAHTQEVAGQLAEALAGMVTDLEKNRRAETLLRGSAVGEPTVPTAVAAPPAWRNPLIGTIAGLALGLALAVLAGRLDPRVHDRETVEELLGAPVLGRVPAPRRRGRRAAASHPGPPPIDELRTNVFFLRTSSTRALRIALTGVAPMHGTGALAASLAASLADTGARVLLMDATLTPPGPVAREAVPNEEGFHFEDGGSSQRDEAHSNIAVPEPARLPAVPGAPAGPARPRAPHSDGVVDVVPADQDNALSGDLLHGAAFESFLDRTSRKYDFLIVATDQVEPGGGALAVAARTDLTLVATHRRGTRKRTLERARMDLARVNVHVAGAVIVS